MRSPMRTEWIKGQGLQMQGLWSRKVFQIVLRTSLTPQVMLVVFSTRFRYKIQRKGVEVDKCKVQLVVQGEHMKRKGADGVGYYDEAFSRYLLHVVFAQFSVLPLNLTCVQIMSPSPRPSYKKNYCQETVTIENFTFLLGRTMKRTLDTFIVFSRHFTEYRQPPERGIRR